MGLGKVRAVLERVLHARAWTCMGVYEDVYARAHAGVEVHVYVHGVETCTLCHS